MLNGCEQSPSVLWDAQCARGIPCSGSAVTCHHGLSMHMAKDSHKILLLLNENLQTGHCFLSLHQCLGLCWTLLGFLVQLLWGIAQSYHGTSYCQGCSCCLQGGALWKPWLQVSVLVLLAHCWEGTLLESCLSLTKLWCRAAGRSTRRTVYPTISTGGGWKAGRPALSCRSD